MKQVYLADPNPDERTALRLLINELKMAVVGEAEDWPTMFAQAPRLRPDMILVDWGMANQGPGKGLWDLRKACQGAVVIVLISSLDAHEPAVQSAGADVLINKGETAEKAVEQLRNAMFLLT